VETASRDVERWLLGVESAMHAALRRLLGDSVQAAQRRPRDVWVFEWPAQCVVTASQIAFTHLVTKLVTSEGAKVRHPPTKCRPPLPLFPLHMPGFLLHDDIA